MRIFLCALASSMMAGCCTVTRCWEKPEGFEFAMTSTTVQRIEGKHRFACDEHQSTEFDEGAWVTICKNAFQDYVMGEHCGPTATRFCAEKCPTDETCKPSGEQTLARNCAENNIAEFLRRIPYCQDFELENAKLVPKPGGMPHCP